jgi:anti-anti-sigma factor
MNYQEAAIPLEEELEADSAPPAAPDGRNFGKSDLKMALEAERLGLLAGTRGVVEVDRRMEEWIASQLDLEDAVPNGTPRSAWYGLIEGLPGLRRPTKRPVVEKEPEAKLEGWERFQVAYKRGITLVRLVDSALVREPQIQEFACDILDLIEAGNHRIVLNFRSVERLASWVVVVVSQAQRACASRDGGALRVCALRPELAAVFRMAGVDARIAAFPDETAALESPWPEPSGPRPLPIEILTALLRSADIPPVSGGAPVKAVAMAEVVSQGATAVQPAASPRRGAAPQLGVWLDVQIGGTKGRLVTVGASRFVIGRDSSCQLRLGSPMVSKLHAALERRDGLILLRDLGSTNGTIVNGRPLHGREVEIQNGDRIQVGPVIATILVGPTRPGAEKVEDMIADWLVDGPHDRSLEADKQPTADLKNSSDVQAEAEPESRITFEVIQDVLVVTPRTSALDDDEVIELLRDHFRRLFDQPLPRDVVVNLEYVGHLSGHAIGVLLAHHLRLDRVGGAMRLCQARARIIALLHQVHLTMLVECHATLDEAVLGAWPSANRRG